MRLEKRKNHTLEAIVDRIILKPYPADAAGERNAALASTPRTTRAGWRPR